MANLTLSQNTSFMFKPDSIKIASTSHYQTSLSRKNLEPFLSGKPELLPPPPSSFSSTPIFLVSSPSIYSPISSFLLMSSLVEQSGRNPQKNGDKNPIQIR